MAPATPVPAVVVVIVWLVQPFVPVNVYGPTPPLLIFVSVIVDFLVLVNVQFIVAPGAVPPTAISTKLDDKLFVVLPAPVPVQAMLVKA